ncbi:probable 6-phosphogluconolactonase 4, chloroplastic [Amaranthus tricolor]|uniref:probable 6-phosphogluconolactonase 4, chloroplastic n=1 Tax=Amaranthus tricolor TaxID=29722 RepID=UPI00258ABC29|nr:probable 6-phosphogluconolactonase 4, chloroplastic [Amaranthus tricolor]
MSAMKSHEDGVIVNIFESEEVVACELAKYVANLSEKFVNEKGKFTVVLSGGYLIHNIRKLLEPPYKDSVDWSKWHVFWVDERCVPRDHDDSNYKLALDGFISKVPILLDQVYGINDTLPDPEAQAEDYEKCLRKLVQNNVIATSTTTGFPKFDLMLLGMGPDGHVASLFPGHPLLKEDEKWVTFIMDSPKPPPQRITFTFPVINSSAYIAMTVVGNGEVNAVKKVLGDTNICEILPAGRVSPEEEMTWFLDTESTSLL